MKMLQQISDCIVNMGEEQIEALITQAIETDKQSLEDIFSQGLHHGMVIALRLYDEKQYDLPEVIVCADTLNKGIKFLQQYGDVQQEKKGKILLAVVEGDTHEIGKNIVKIMVEAAGYEVKDIGVNQSTDDIIKAALSDGVQIIGLSSMMTTTRGEMEKLIAQLHAMNLANRPLVIIGGGSVTRNYAKEIKADGYAANAPETIKLLQQLLKEGAKNDFAGVH